MQESTENLDSIPEDMTEEQMFTMIHDRRQKKTVTKQDKKLKVIETQHGHYKKLKRSFPGSRRKAFLRRKKLRKIQKQSRRINRHK